MSNCVSFSQLTMTENYLNRNQTVTGERNASNRPRARSESYVLSCRIDCETEELKDFDLPGSTREVTDVVDMAKRRSRANTSPTLLLSNECEVISRPLQKSDQNKGILGKLHCQIPFWITCCNKVTRTGMD